MMQVFYRTGMGGGVGYALCNCCLDGCLPLMNRQAYRNYRWFIRGTQASQVDANRCTACGACAEVCALTAYSKSRRVMVMKLKRFVSETSSYALLAVLASLVLAREAHAYLDPGAGSYILQILIAGLFGALFMLKLFWGRIVGLFGKGSSQSETTAQGPRQGMSNQISTSENVQPSVQSIQSERSDE